jgi:predicted DNA-binding ribbon-helix-helix protein
LSDLVGEIDSGRPHGNLSSAIRLFVLDHYRAKTNGAVERSGQTSLGEARGSDISSAAARNLQ